MVRLGKGRALVWCCCGPLPTEAGMCALASGVLAGNPPLHGEAGWSMSWGQGGAERDFKGV